jgi:hypothetical protein
VQADETEILEAETLFAAPQGQIMLAGATPAHELIAVRARQIEAQRGSPDDGSPGGEALKNGLRRLLALPEERPLAHYRVLRPVPKPREQAREDEGEPEVLARYAVESEGHIRVLLWKSLTPPLYPFSLDVAPEVHLYLPHVSSEMDLGEDALAASLKASGPLYALDVRGLGQSLPEEERDGFFQPYGMDYMFHAYGLMLGQSYLGRRVHDVLCTMDLLCHEGVTAIHLVGRGQGALLALFAALYHEQVVSLTLKNGPRSYVEWTQTPLVTWPAANFLKGVLELCDLPDCLRALREKLGAENIRVLEPWGPKMQPV